jgi:Domain of unknown function (DUF6458)
VGIPVSLFLITGGAILAFAVTGTSSEVDITTVGWILMITGLLGLLLSLVLWDTWAGGGFWSHDAPPRRRRPPSEATTRVGRAPRRHPPR